MPDQKPTSQQMELEKKLRKRERRLQERLQEAQQAHGKAVERLKRAESRVQKRQLRIQRVEDRLTSIHRQLQEFTSSPGQPTTTLQIEGTFSGENGVGADISSPSTVATSSAEAVPIEAETVITGVEQPVPPPQPATAPEVDHPSQATEDTQSSQPPSPIVAATGLAKLARTMAETTERAARIAMARAMQVAARLEQLSSGRHMSQELLPVQSEAEQVQAGVQEAPQATQEAEHRVMQVGEQGLTTDASGLVGKTQAESLVSELTDEQQTTAVDPQPDTSPIVDQAELVQEDEQETAAVTTQAGEEPQTDQLMLAPGDAQEAIAVATQAGEVMQADQLVAQTGDEEHSAPATDQVDELFAAEQALTQAVAEEQAVPVQMQTSENMNAEAVPDSDEQAAAPQALATRSDIEEIEDEEEVVSAVAAMMIADVAAAAAAEAEALAEASSARTREARFQALQADQILEEVRIAIASGVLSGEDAETSLRTAELEATHAHALLADAEAAEEQARNTAMNAEAEAEVAEGMAFAADAHADLVGEEIAMSVAGEENGHIQNATSHEPDLSDDLDITIERPVIRPQEME